MISDRSPSYKRHQHCPVWIVIHEQPHAHYASLICKTHSKWIQWISKHDVDQMLALELAEIRPKKRQILTADDLNI